MTNSRGADEDNELPSEEFIRRALQSASLNPLRIALYHQTGDPELAAMRIEKRQARGGALMAYALAEEHGDEIRAKAFDYLTSDAPMRPDPTKEEAAPLMRLFTGQDLTPTEIDYGYEDLAFAPIPRDVTWTDGPPVDALADFSVTIVGAGISGIAAAIQLDRLGIAYRIVDRQDGIGGTWHINDYPEARVDIPTFLYQYRFEKKYPWSSYFATRDELKDYLEHIVDRYGIRQHISLQTTLVDATWDDARSNWVLQTRGPDGTPETIVSNVVISASGLFSTPNLPDIDGIETYEGAMFHTTAWDHSFDHAGKRVAVIGTGSTGAQLMPGVAKTAGYVGVYQRTPNWVTPIRGYQSSVPEHSKWLLQTMPGYWNWFIYSNYIAELEMQELQVVDPEWCTAGGVVSERNEAFAETLKAYVRSKVGPDNDELYDKLIPDYPPLARRLVMDNGWYDALMQDHVELHADGIERITPTGIVSVDGTERAYDLIVLGAGFKVSQYLWPVPYTGRGGTTLEDLWAHDGARAYVGLTMPGFPNFFTFYGPNGQARGGGFHSWAEIFSRYCVGLVVEMIERGKSSLEVRRDVFDDYNARMDVEHEKILWELEGVGGYYVNEHGRSGVNMPWTIHDYYEMIRTPDTENYDFA